MTGAETPITVDAFFISAFDSLLGAKSRDLCKRLQTIRGQIRPTLEAIPITHYSHNSVSHAIQCTNLVTELFAEAIETKLSAFEVFILGLFCFVHDVGMESRPNMTPEQVYRAHNVYSQDYVLHLGVLGLLTAAESDCIGALCLMHNKDLDRAKRHFNLIDTAGARLPIIFAMFRVADMLDVETQPGEILRIKPEIVAQMIGELEFNPRSRKVTIWRGHTIAHKEFSLWSRFFDTRLRTLNEELGKVGATLSWATA